MEKLVYIDACVRDEESRTKRIAEPIVEALSSRYEVERITLNELHLEVVQKEKLKERMNGHIEEPILTYAKHIASADRIVISSPFWDMGIPACLKAFLELCSLFTVTFEDDGTKCVGLCKAQKMLYITTRGMNIETGSVLEQATPYLKALSWLWGIGPLTTIECHNMDYRAPEDIESQINKAIVEGKDLAKTF